MASAVTVGLVVAATAAIGLLAGLNVDRLIVQMSAWEEVGALDWATYSREADLGNGLILYSSEAIGGAILTVAAAVAFRFDRGAPRFAAVPIYAAVVLVVGGLFATTQAAPIMLSLREIGDDPADLRRAFEGFNRWGRLGRCFRCWRSAQTSGHSWLFRGHVSHQRFHLVFLVQWRDRSRCTVSTGLPWGKENV